MQKKFIALAVAGLVSGAAFAQTSVVISGNVDLGYNVMNREAKEAGVKIKDKTNSFIGSDASGWSSSELRFSVTEGLGNGLSSGFYLAVGLNPVVGGDGIDQSLASGNNTALGRTRNGFVFLKSNTLGQVAVGYKDTIEGQINGIGNAGSGNLGNIGRAFNSKISDNPYDDTAMLGLADTSRANVVEYASPVFSGFQVLGQYGNTKNHEDLDEAGFADQNSQVEGTYWGLGGKYANGPLNLGAYYQQINRNNQNEFVAANGIKFTPAVAYKDAKNDQDAWGLMGNYDFKVAKVFASYTNRSQDQTNKNAAGVRTQKDDNSYYGWDLGVQVPVGERVTLSANYGQGEMEYKDKLAVDTYRFDVDAYQLAASYAFSKRTSLIGYYANTKWDGAKDARDAEYKADTYGFGLRHQF